MKKSTLVLTILLCCSTLFSQSYRIVVQYKPVPNSRLYLGYYFGTQKYVLDSALLDSKGEAVFSGAEKLTGGLYIVVDPQKKTFVDILVDKEQEFNVSIDSAAFTIISIKGSKENDYLKKYKDASAFYYSNYPQLMNDLAVAKTKQDSAAIQRTLNEANVKAQQWRDSFITAQPDAYLSLLFRLLKEPVYSAAGAKTKQDSINAFYQYKKQFWPNISFADERLLRTPMFEQRLNRYMETAVIREPDSIKLELDKFILYSRTNKTMFRYFINRFTNEYMNPKYMGLDVVFLHLFEKYYLTNQVDWLEKKDRDLVFNRAYNIYGNIVGEPAAELNLLDTLNRKVNLYSIKSPYTVVIFWDPDCGHCKEQVPKVDSLYRASWKQQGVKVVGVLSDGSGDDEVKAKEIQKKWTEYIRTQKLSDWVHLYQSTQMRKAEQANQTPGFRQAYDVFQTPTIYLLDEQKRIVAKKINPEQVDELLQFKKNNQTSKHP
jgi:thiol-disulfide isomerase/thioredoxin